MDDRAKSSPYSPQRWQAMLDELGRRPSAVGFDILDAHAERESLLARVDMSYATADGRWISLTVDVAASHVDINDPAFCRSWVEFFYTVLDPADPAFGYVTDDNRFPDYTDLDLALRRKWTLCGYPHKVHYAEHRIMPSGCRGAMRDRGLVLMESA